MNEKANNTDNFKRVVSPESLNEYIRVSNPGVWLLLTAVIALLLGALVWGIFGTMESTLSTVVSVEAGNISCYVNDSDISELKIGMTVKTEGFEGVLSDIAGKTELGYLCIISSDSTPEDGIYSGKIVLKEISPLSFVTN